MASHAHSKCQSYGHSWGLAEEFSLNCRQDLLERCMQRDHKKRPDFHAIVAELEEAISAAQRSEENAKAGTQDSSSTMAISFNATINAV